MLTWIVVNDLLKHWTTSTENNLVSFELSQIIRDQGYIGILTSVINLSKHAAEVVRESMPAQIVFRLHIGGIWLPFNHWGNTHLAAIINRPKENS